MRKISIDPRILKKEKVHHSTITKAAMGINLGRRKKDPSIDHQEKVDLGGSRLFIVFNILRSSGGDEELYIREARHRKK